MSNSLGVRGLLNSPGQNTRVGSCSLLQGILPTQGSNPGLPHCRQILYQLSHQGSPRILEWVAYPFSSRSSRTRNQPGVSCIAGRFFTSWATREALKCSHPKLLLSEYIKSYQLVCYSWFILTLISFIFLILHTVFLLLWEFLACIKIKKMYSVSHTLQQHQ